MTSKTAPPADSKHVPVYLNNEQLLKYGRDAAHAVGAPMGLAYCPQNSEQAQNFEPHRWVLEAIQSAFLDGQCFARGESSVRMSRYGVVPPNEPTQ